MCFIAWKGATDGPITPTDRSGYEGSAGIESVGPMRIFCKLSKINYAWVVQKLNNHFPAFVQQKNDFPCVVQLEPFATSRG